ncbi:inositol 2-dehydrogenase-like [Diadema antillarum]|uniref:inositol 2-dehydrogenase-like n=1 Tax=Diadema antillarum TaxID=105358 RepID=UPI003A852AD3
MASRPVKGMSCIRRQGYITVGLYLATRMNNKGVGVALFGLGRIAQVHIKNLVADPRVDLRWIVEADVDFGKKVMAQTTGLANAELIAVDNADKVWKDERTRAIIVCTPTFTHDQIVLDGLKAGKAVFCEKPLSMTLNGVKALYTLAEECGLPLFCAFNRRFDPHIRAVRDQVVAGSVGVVRRIHFVANDLQFPSIDYLKISGGIYLDSGIHEVDIVCWIVGEAPETVFAQGLATDPRIADINDVDEAIIVLKFPSGVLATIQKSREAIYGFDQRLEVKGTKGLLQMKNVRSGPSAHHCAGSVTYDPIHSEMLKRYEESYRLEMTHFLDVVEGNTDALDVSKADTVLATRVCDLCRLSDKEGKLVTFSS